MPGIGAFVFRTALGLVVKRVRLDSKTENIEINPPFHENLTGQSANYHFGRDSIFRMVDNWTTTF
jgi:hypothetical protein